MNLMPFHGYDLRGDLCRLALAWTRDQPLVPLGDERCMRAFLAGRVREVAVRAAAARPTALLGTPTHEHGWIDPETLVARATALTEPPDPLDAMQSLLRIAREGRAAALARAANIPGEYGAALRFKLGGERPAAAPANDLWLCAEAGRTGDDCDERFDLLRHPMNPRVGDNNRAMTINETLTMRWVVTVFPADLSSYFRGGGSIIIWNLDWSQALWWNAVYLEPLLRDDVPFGTSACRLVGAALAAKNAAEGGLAVDVVIRAVEDGRADAAVLGDTCAAMLGAEVANPSWGNDEEHVAALRADKLIGAPIKCARWAKRFTDVARASPRHAAFVRDAVERALRGLPTPPPRDLGPLLALLRELTVETGTPLRDPEARARLATLGGSGGATGKLARALLSA